MICLTTEIWKVFLLLIQAYFMRQPLSYRNVTVESMSVIVYSEMKNTG